MPSADIETVIVYDDNESEAQTRTEHVRSLLLDLSKDGPLTSMPELVTATLRPECFEALEASESSILIADLMSINRRPKGARLLRAVAANDAVRERTWRIALTRRSHPLIATELEGFAHAVVVYPPDGGMAALGDAIGEVLTIPDSSTAPPGIYPANLKDLYPKELDRRLGLALRGEYDEELAEAAFRMISDRPAKLVSEQDMSRDPRWRRVKESSTRLQRILRERWGADLSTTTMKEILVNYLFPVSREGVWEQINPEVVSIGFTNEAAIALHNYERFAKETWLTEAEHQAAAEFFAAAREHRLDRPRRTSEAAFTAIDDVLQDSRYLEYLDGTGLSTWDACYAVLTIADWWMDSKEYALRLKVE